MSKIVGEWKYYWTSDTIDIVSLYADFCETPLGTRDVLFKYLLLSTKRSNNRKGIVFIATISQIDPTVFSLLWSKQSVL